jgi:DNA (cytosine-5)-methyltransferase 1
MKNTQIQIDTTIRFIDLFAGIGGFRYAMQNAGGELGIHTKCVFTSEIDNEYQKVR